MECSTTDEREKLDGPSQAINFSHKQTDVTNQEAIVRTHVHYEKKLTALTNLAVNNLPSYYKWLNFPNEI